MNEHLPLSLVRDDFADSELHQPIFDFLAQRCQAQVEYILSEIRPCAVDAEVATRLAISAGQPILEFNEVFYSHANQPLVLATVYFRDEIIRFHALRRMSPLR